MAQPDGATQVLALYTRISPLSTTGSGAVPVGAGTYGTDTLLKASFAPAMETGVDLVTVGADGNIKSAYKHGDMPKYYTMTIDMASPDPVLHNILAGGTILTDNSTALATPVAPTATPGTSGTLAAGTYEYAVAAANQYGETVPSPTVSATTSGSTGDVALVATALTGAVYYRWYGRLAGNLQLLAQTAGIDFTDTGALVPNGSSNTVNTTAGPGNAGYQSAPLYVPGNHYGVSLEFWGMADIEGAQTPNLPYFRWVVPAVTDIHEEAREFGPTIMPNTFVGISRKNPGWGAGPFGDWQFDSSEVFQYARAGQATIPVVSLATTAATA